jgi:DNA-binding response OmpR family regulator
MTMAELSGERILVVEDDESLVLGLESALRREGYQTHTARTGPEGLCLAKQFKPKVVILDIMLPGMSGLEVCKHLRDDGCGARIIMLTSKVEEDDKVLGLELGADDYVTKPFSVRELLARTRVQLRHEESSGGPEKFAFGEVVVDFKRREVYKNGELQELTNREFRLLEYFTQHPGELLTRERLLNEIWGYAAYPTTRTVDNHVLRLRKHTEPNPETPQYIKTLRGAGYMFEPDGCTRRDKGAWERESEREPSRIVS